MNVKIRKVIVMIEGPSTDLVYLESAELPCPFPPEVSTDRPRLKFEVPRRNTSPPSRSLSSTSRRGTRTTSFTCSCNRLQNPLDLLLAHW
jgi:hypothetical protein